MTTDLIIVLSLLALAIIAFVRNKPRMDVVALMAIVALPMTGVITVDDALSGFSDQSVILIVAFFVIGEGLVRTGIAYSLGDWLVKKSQQNETRLLVLLMLSVGLLGSVMSSTGIVAIFIPIVLNIARKMKTDPRRLMMPLSFAALISGMTTLVATAPNLVVSSQLQQAGYVALSFFSFTPIGLVVLILGIVYMFFARRLLTEKKASAHIEQGHDRYHFYDFIRDYKLTGRNARVRVLPGSKLLGHTLADLRLRENHNVNIIAFERKQGLTQDIIDAIPDREIRHGDILLIDFFYPEFSDAFCAQWCLQKLPFRGDYFTDQSRSIGMVEVIIPPESTLVNQTLFSHGFRSHYHVNVVGIRRNGAALTEDLINIPLKAGDTLLAIGTWVAIKRLHTFSKNILVLSIPAEVDEVAPASSKAPYAIISLMITIGLMVSGAFPNVLVALFGCLLMGAFRCVTMESAYKSIHWQSIVLIVGMFPFALALQKTGGVDLAVDALLTMVGDAGPRTILSCLFVLTATIGLFISNTATAVLLAPIAIQTAIKMEVSPYPFAMTVAIAASAAFMTPVSSPVNTLVVTPGRYKFVDFIKVGVPFTAIIMAVCITLVPILFPL